MTLPPDHGQSVTERTFSQGFSSTPFGARLARRLAVLQLHVWGIPYGSERSDTAALLVAELAANAVVHGRMPGRDFQLALTLLPGLLRIEVSDTWNGPCPPVPGQVASPPSPLAESGRGLVLIDALCDRWSALDRSPAGKTVRVELDIPR